MSNLLDYIRGKLKVHSPSKEWPEIEKLEYTDKRVYDIPTKAYLGLDPIISIDKDKQIVVVLERRGVIIQFDSMIKPETIEILKEDIQKQIKEHGFAVVDGRCKIVEFDNPKAVIETK